MVKKSAPVLSDEQVAQLLGLMKGADGVELKLTVPDADRPGSMKAKLDPLQVKQAFAGRRRISKLFTKEQRDFYTAHAPEGVALDELSMLGPINVMKLKFTPGEFGRRLVAELWFYPDGSRILELSTKCAPAEAFDVAAQTKAFLAEHGVDLAGEQQTKTKSALDFFAGELQAAERQPS